MTLRNLKGAKGGGGSAPQPTRTPDSLRSRDTVETALGICEGEIEGLRNGLKDFFVDDTPLQNPDGSWNFNKVWVDLKRGVSDPSTVKYKLGGASRNEKVGVSLRSEQSVTRETSVADDFDILEVRLIVNRLLKSTNKGTFETDVRLSVECKAKSETNWKPFFSGDLIINGKTTQPYVKELRKRVERRNEPYLVRVTKFSKENTTEYFADISWESWQEVDLKPKAYPDTAVIHFLGEASDQFASLPTFSGIYRGRRVKIPSNYDGTMRTYDGSWDGTFKIAWTNNPAWICYDFVMNDRFGINSYYGVNLDKYDVYEAAQWCDQRVPDGEGGTQPRYSFNALLTEPMNGQEMARYIAGVFNATFYDDLNGTAHLKVDKDDPAVALFTKENTIDGKGFDYSFTPIEKRFNDITVTFRNPNLGWKRDRRRVYDQDHIDRHGRIPHNFAAVGCTNPQESIQRAQYKLITSLTETMTVTFETNRQGAALAPYDIILIADEDMGYSKSGRIEDLSSDRKTIYLRDPIYLELGITYTFRVHRTNGIFETEITSDTTGNVTQFEVADALPTDVPEKAVFSLGDGSGHGLPKPFRVMSVVEGEHPDAVSIDGVEVNRNKWVDADNVSPPDEIQYSKRKSLKKVDPAGAVTAKKNITSDASGLRLDIDLEWEPSGDTFFRRYVVEYRRNGGTPKIAAETRDTQLTLENMPHGEYEFSVYAVNIAGYHSPPSVTTLELGDIAPIELAKITGLEIEGQGNDTSFDERNVKLTWRTNSKTGSYELGQEVYGADTGWLDPTFRDFEVRIFDPNTDEMVFETHTTDTFFVYDFERNQRNQGPLRKFRAEIRIRDKYNRKSAPAKLTVNNPAPALPSNVRLRTSFNTAFLQYTPPEATDWQGIQVWMSETSGFTPDDSTLVYDGPNTLVAIDSLDPEKTYYFRYACYDVFGKTGLNVSSELQAQTASLDIPEALPNISFSGLTFTPNSPSQDEVTWSSGEAHVLKDGQTTTYQISSDSAAWAGGTLYIYYVRGESQLRTTSQVATAMASNQIVVATYKGGTDVKMGNGDALIDGNQIISRQIAANHLVTGKAVVTGTAQIANLIVTDAKIKDLVVDKLLSGTITAQDIFIGGTEFKLDGQAQQLIVKDQQSTPQDRVRLGKLGSNNDSYGIEIMDRSGNVILRTGSTEEIDGGFLKSGSVATTHIASAAITNAKVNDLLADKITGGTIAATNTIYVGNTGNSGYLRLESDGMIQSHDGSRTRVWLGNIGGNYGLIIDGPNGERILDSRNGNGVDGTYIKNLTVDTIKITSNAVSRTNVTSGSVNINGGGAAYVDVYVSGGGELIGWVSCAGRTEVSLRWIDLSGSRYQIRDKSGNGAVSVGSGSHRVRVRIENNSNYDDTVYYVLSASIFQR